MASSELRDWSGARPPGPWRLAGRYARLERLRAHHAAPLHAALAGHEGLWRFLPYGPFADLEAYRGWVARAAATEDPMFYALAPEGAAPEGVASFLRIVPGQGTIEIGHICFGPGLQGTRAGTDALMTLAGWALGAGYRRLEWKCDAANLASRRAAQRLGFSFEGVHRQAAVVKERNRDTAWFSILDREWPALSRAWDRWRSPGNFDADGRQREALSDLTAPLLAARDPALVA